MGYSSGLPASSLFGIAWEVVITESPNDLGQQNPPLQVFDNGSRQQEQLEIEFECISSVASGETGFWFADISIYGLNGSTTTELINYGQGVKLSAGWANSALPYGVIFEGTVYQPMWERIDGVNYKLRLRCIVGLLETTLNFTANNIAAGSNQRAAVAAMVQNAVTPLTANFDSNIPQSGYVNQSRGEVFFGQPSDYLQNIAKELKANVWISNLAANIRNIRQLQDNVPTVTYNANTGLIDTPQMTNDGVIIRVLLDPRLQLAGQIQLDPTVAIAQQPRTQGSYPYILDKNGTYGIVHLAHRGNSRGNTWETEVTALTYVNAIMSLLNDTN